MSAKNTFSKKNLNVIKENAFKLNVLRKMSPSPAADVTAKKHAQRFKGASSLIIFIISYDF